MTAQSPISHKISLIGFMRQDVNADLVIVTAEFSGTDPWSGEYTSETRTINLSDTALGMKWDEDDILFAVSDMFPMVEVQWMQTPELPSTPQVIAVPAIEVVPPVAEPVMIEEVPAEQPAEEVAIEEPAAVPAVESPLSSDVEPAPDNTP